MKKILDLSQEKEIIELCKNFSQLKISKQYNVNQATISKILIKHGIHSKNSTLGISKLSLDIDYFKDINTKEKAYWLGYITADGTITKKNNKVSIASIDEERLIKFKDDIKSGHKITKSSSFDKRTNKTYTRFMIQIGNELFTNYVVSQGVTNNKTNVCEFPKINEEFYSYYIAGLFDGDGSVSFNKNNLRINLISSLEILTFIQTYILKEFGITKLVMFKVSRNKPNVWKLYLYKDAIKFLNFIYQDYEFSYMKRKYKRYKDHLELKQK